VTTIKLILVNIVLLFTVYIYAQAVDNIKTVNLNCYDQPLHSVLEKLRTQTGFDIIYSNDLVDNMTITCMFDGCSVENALENILKHHNISYKVFNGKSFVLFKVNKPVKKQYKTLVVQKNYSDEETSLLDSEPQVITKINPIYPLDAVRNKIEGNVSVRFLVTAEGNVKNSLVEQSSGSSILDSATVAYSKTLKYIPAYFKDKPRNVWISMKFKYFITNK
jgi:TonB family protein